MSSLKRDQAHLVHSGRRDQGVGELAGEGAVDAVAHVIQELGFIVGRRLV